MNQRILTVSAICAVFAALLAGCGSSAVKTSASHTSSGMALARRVLKLSGSQNVTAVEQTASGTPRSSLMVTVMNRQIREGFGSDGKPTVLQIDKHAYLRSQYQLIGSHPRLKQIECYAAIGTVWPELSQELLPRGAKIVRVTRNTIYFKGSDSSLIKRGISTGFSGHGYFHFNGDDLITSEILYTQATRTLNTRTTLAFSYPKTAPATLVTKPPTNICKS